LRECPGTRRSQSPDGGADARAHQRDPFSSGAAGDLGSSTIARDMGNGATVDSAARAEVNGHQAVNHNGHVEHDAEVDGGGAVARAARLPRGRVLAPNASSEPLNVCTVRRALVLILKEKAEVLEHGDGVLRSETMRLDRPEVIRLITFVRVPRDVHRRRIT